MVTKLVKKTTFAGMAGVSNAAITKACKPGAALAAAMVGKMVDAIHPAALDYLARQNNAVGDEGDPRYAEVLQWCTTTGQWTVAGIHANTGISKERARKLLELFKVEGLIPVTTTRAAQPPAAPPTPKAPPPPPPPVAPAVSNDVPPPPPTTRVVSGHEARRVTKKDEALDRLGTGTMLHEVPENIEAFADMSLRELIQRFGTDAAFLDWLKATKTIEEINDRRIKNAEARGELVSRKLVKVAIIDPIDAAHTKLLTDGAKTIARRVVAMTEAGRTIEECEEFAKDQISSFIRPVKSKVSTIIKELG